MGSTYTPENTVYIFTVSKTPKLPLIKFSHLGTFSAHQVAKVLPVGNCTYFVKDMCTKLWLLFGEILRQHIS